MVRFFLVLCITALSLMGLAFLAKAQNWINAEPSFLYQTLIFLLFTTGVIFVYLYKLNNPEIFVQLYLLSMVVKLGAYGFYCYFMITSDKAGASENVVFFMLAYFIFTGLEIAFLHRKISQINTP